MEIEITVITEDEGENEVEETVSLPAKYEVCDGCGGQGTIVNPNIDSHGISPAEFAEDPDFEEAYFSGAYDIACPECNGLRVVKVVNEDILTNEQRKLYEQYQEDQYNEACYKYECYQERRMGC